jgi:hypothetical protein
MNSSRAIVYFTLQCFFLYNKHTHIHFNETQATSMSDKVTPSFLTLPIEVVHRILDNLDQLTILLSVRDVCTRLNTITDSYHRYQVKFSFILSTSFSSTKNLQKEKHQDK